MFSCFGNKPCVEEANVKFHLDKIPQPKVGRGGNRVTPPPALERLDVSDDDDDDVGSDFHYADGEAEWDDNDGWGSDDFPEEEAD